MKQFIATLGALIAITAASPTPSSNHHLVARAEPSDFPGEGDACTNEPKYLNFDIENDVDKDRVTKLHDAFCNGIGNMFVRAGQIVELADRTIYERWFVEDDDEDPPEDEQVLSVYDRLWNRDDNEAQSIAADFIFDNTDFLGGCADPDVEIGGYTGKDEDGDEREKTHFCDVAFAYPTKPEDVDCTKLGSYPDGRMESLSRIMLHELTHYETVGQGSDIEFTIGDSKNKDIDDDTPGLFAYYPSRCHALVSEKPDQVDGNADNYAWLAAEAFYTFQCKKKFGNPPPYDPEQPGDPDEPEPSDCKRGLNVTCPGNFTEIPSGIFSRRVMRPVRLPF